MNSSNDSSVPTDTGEDSLRPPEPWWVFYGDRPLEELPPPPPWRAFSSGTDGRPSREEWQVRADQYRPGRAEVEMVNAALYLRRPLLITGKPGVGKSSLAYAVASRLGLERPLVWPITTRATLASGLYRYDAIGRLQAAALESELSRSVAAEPAGEPGGAEGAPAADPSGIAPFLRLGPLGTALATSRPGRPRVLLIDEIDKSDIDLPSDLLNVLEEGAFSIPELERLGPEYTVVVDADGTTEERVEVTGGRVGCREFPVVLLTSNGERDFPPAFLRRCLRLDIEEPTPDRLSEIVSARLAGVAPEVAQIAADLVNDFHRQREGKDLSTDQLLNAVYLALKQIDGQRRDRLSLAKSLQNALFRELR
jgi:MoxR-like ATPase